MTDSRVPAIPTSNLAKAYRGALVVLLFCQLLMGLYGIDQAPQFGHQGYHVAEHGLGARNLARWGTLTHTTHHGLGEPPEASLNFRHLAMLQVPVWVVQSVLGDQGAWTLRVVALFFSLAAVLGVWTFTLKARGPTVATVATAAFVFNPLHVAFANLPDIQMVSIAWLIWAGVALLALFDRPTWLRIGLLWLCVANAAFADWPFYPVVFFVILFVALKVRPHAPLLETMDRTEVRRVRVALSGMGVLPLVILAQHAMRAQMHGKMGDLLAAYELRSHGAGLGEFIAPGLDMLAFGHTKLLLMLGALWLIWSLLARRGDVATRFIVAIFLGQTIYMLRFQSEFWIHEYRSYWYVLPLAFAAGDLAAGAGRVLARAFGRPVLADGLTLLLGAVALSFVLAEAIPMLDLSRARAGSTRFDDYHPRSAQMVAARAIRAVTAPGTSVGLGLVLEDRLELHWLIDRPSRQIVSAEELTSLGQRERHSALFHSANIVREPPWAHHVKDGRVLLVDDYAIVELGPDLAPSVEQARHMIPPIYGPIQRWLKAADGPTVLVPGAPTVAAAFASAVGANDAVIERALAGQTPVLDALPHDLAFHEIPSSHLAFTRRVGGGGGNENTAQCWRRQAVSQIAVAPAIQQPERLAWIQPFCQDVAKGSKRLSFLSAPEEGPRFGLPQGNATLIRCPDPMVPVGVSVRADHLVNQLRLLCSEIKRQPGSSTSEVEPMPWGYARGPLVEHGAVGGKEGEVHDLVCPAGTLVFGLLGRTGALVDALSLSCIAVDAVLGPP